MHHVVRQADDVADSFLRSSRAWLRPVSRLLLLCTFIEDGLRMVSQWTEQQQFMRSIWHCGHFLAFLIVFINFSCQLLPCVLIMAQKFVRIGVGCLIFAVIFQSVIYHTLWTFGFFLRNAAIIGSLLFLAAETTEESARSVFAMLPSLPSNSAGDYLQVSGRILIAGLFATLIKFDSALRIGMESIGLVLVVLVAVGFKTKVSALALVVLLTLQNLLLNNFWSIASSSSSYDFIKYDFFQTLTVVGGLLLLVAIGPGGVSIDSRKKFS